MSSWEALKKRQLHVINTKTERNKSDGGTVSSATITQSKEKSSLSQQGRKRKRSEPIKEAVARLQRKAGDSMSSTAMEVAEEERPTKEGNGKTKTALFQVELDYVPDKIKEKYIALDNEMVGIGPSGKRSALARCCLVDFDGEVLYDKHVRPQAFVTDFRTKYSGVRSKDLRTGHAIPLQQCQKEVAALMKDKILVGHALKNDLDVLMLSHPQSRIRDTARYRPYMRPHGKKGGKFKPRSLKDLSRQFLGEAIQGGEHDPSEDARCAMFLFRRCRREWEESLRDPLKAKLTNMKKPADTVEMSASTDETK